MFNRVIFIVFLSLNLFACSAPGVKPKDANLLEAAVNISSGEFDGQLSRKKLKLEQSEDLLNSETDKNQSLNRNLQTLKIEKQALDTQLVALQNENFRLTQQSNKTKAATSIQQNQRDEQIIKISELNSSISQLKRKRVSSKGNNKYKARVTSLQQEINVLRKMISNQ